MALHCVVLGTLAFVAFRIPLPDQLAWIDISSHTELPNEELIVDTGFSEMEFSDVVSPGLASADLQLDSSSTLTLSLPSSDPLNAGGSGRSSSGGSGGNGGVDGVQLPEPVAKLVASRGGRVLKGQQRGVSATLQWEGHDDLDLHVEIGREKCFFQKMKTPSLELDVDANWDPDKLVDDPVENIVTRAKSTPRGRFRISVHHFESHNRGQARPFTVFIVADGVCQSFRGVVELDQMKLISEFEGTNPFGTDERIADSKWMTAQTAAKRNDPETAAALFEDLITNHPGTPAAKKARDLLQANGKIVK